MNKKLSHFQFFAVSERFFSQFTRFTLPSLHQWNGNALLSTKANALYFHFPFCEKLCSFCDLNIQVTKESSMHLEYIVGLITEVKNTLPEKHPVKAIYLGGGTPSLLNDHALKMFIQSLQEYLSIDEKFEFIIEAHPKDLTKEKLQLFQNLGVTQIRIGFQDFNHDVLENVNRDHNYISPELLKEFPFVYVADFIVGLPLQNDHKIKLTLDRLNDYAFDLINFYPLKTTAFNKQNMFLFGNGTTLQANEITKLLLDIHHQLINTHRALGLGQYLKTSEHIEKNFEVRTPMGQISSNFKNFLGFGVGAISRVENNLWINPTRFNEYKSKIYHISKNDSVTNHQLTENELAFEKQVNDLIIKNFVPFEIAETPFIFELKSSGYINSEMKLSNDGMFYVGPILNLLLQIQLENQ